MIKLVLFLVLISGIALADAQLPSSQPTLSGPILKDEFGKVVSQCKSTDSKRHVWVFKQWHLSPNTSTRDKLDFKSIVQEKNQTAIFRQLDEWIKAHLIKEVFSEGCNSELDNDFLIKFNGWNYLDLEKVKDQPYFSEIVTSVPLKLGVKFKDAVHLPCGDTAVLIKENELAFSDARGAVGFITRLEQYKDDPVRAKTYLEGVVKLFHLSEKTTVQQAIARLNKELKASVAKIKKAIQKRNENLIKAVLASKESEQAIVYGGLHAAGIVELLNKAKVSCTVVEPVGYQDDESLMMHELDTLIAK